MTRYNYTACAKGARHQKLKIKTMLHTHQRSMRIKPTLSFKRMAV